MRKNQERIAIYSRKSRFTGKGESIGNQISLCREYIHTQYGEDALSRMVIYEDEGFSGGNLNRPAFQRMMEAARKRELQAIIVYRLDRISRSISDFSALIVELSQLDIAFISMKEQFDTNTPMGRAMMYIASVFSQLERETIAERIRDNMQELAKTGRWLGGVTPTGYTSLSVTGMTLDGKPKKVCHLALIPEEAAVVRMIYDCYAACGSFTMTEHILQSRGIQTKNGNRFTRYAVKAILQNPVYLIADTAAYSYFLKIGAAVCAEQADFDGIHGILAYHRTHQEKGKTTRFLPPQEWIISVGQHQGIISGKAWASVQERMKQNKTLRKPKKERVWEDSK